MTKKEAIAKGYRQAWYVCYDGPKSFITSDIPNVAYYYEGCATKDEADLKLKIYFTSELEKLIEQMKWYAESLGKLVK